ncbi:MAG: hypothetical protein WD530_05770 [Vicingaceae bacterium]
MKKTHLKYSLLIGVLMVLAVLSAKVSFETKQAVRTSAEQYFEQKTDQKRTHYRYYLQVFKMSNAQ